jgi:heat shock protein HslJ
MMKDRIVKLFFAMLLVALAACTPTGGEPVVTDRPTPADPTTPAEPTTPIEPGENVTLEELEGTDWLLVTYGPAESPTAVLANAPITLSFDNMGELGGQACNHYGGTFTLDGRTLEVSQISQTLMACVDEGVTEQESAYTAALQSANSIYRDGDQLVITYDGGELRFMPAPEPEPTALDGSLWRLSSISDGATAQSALTNSLVLVGFRNGEIVGYAGCNQFGGPFLTEGETITSVEAASTQMLCPDEAIMAQEAALLGGLAKATSYTIEGDTLTINYEGGSLGFTKVASPADSLGTEWRLQAFGLGPDAQPLVTGTEITLTFGQDGMISGSAGCNTFNGPYTLTGTALSIDELAQTRMACDEPILTQETNFINALRSARHAAVDGDLLYIVHDDGILVFTSLAR